MHTAPSSFVTDAASARRFSVVLLLMAACAGLMGGCGGSGSNEPPSSPQSLTATSNDSEIALSWTAGSGGSASGYNVYRATGAPPNVDTASTVNDEPVSATSFADTSVRNGTTYVYVVTAVAGGAESTASNSVEVTPFARPPGSPSSR